MSLAQGRRLLTRYEADQAYMQLQTALKLFTELNDRAGLAATQDALGDVYAQSGQYKVAISQYRNAYEIFRQAGDTENANTVLAKIGERYLLLGELTQARAAFAAINVSQPNQTMNASGLVNVSAERPDGARVAASGGIAALAGLASCFAPAKVANNDDPKDPPNRGRAPQTPNGVGRMDLRVTDEQGQPLRDVRAQIQSSRPGGLYCECWETTDEYGVALLPPIHVADRIKLVLRAPGLPKQELVLAAQDVAQPVRVSLSKTGAQLTKAAPQAATVAASSPCFDFYRALIAFSVSRLGAARANFFGGQMAAARQQYEELLAQLNIPGVERLKQVAHFRAAALTALGDIAFREGRHDEALKLYKEALDGARNNNRLDLMWAAQRGLGRAYWQRYLAAPNDPQAAQLRGEALASYLAAVRTLDTLRAGSLRADEARTTFLANTRDVYDEAITVGTEMTLIAAGQNAPAEASTKAVILRGSALDLAATAIALIEQSRARSLLDLLGEAHASITEGLPADLVKRRDEALARQQEIAQTLLGITPAGVAPPASPAALEQELEELSVTFDGIENTLRTGSPRYASLTGAKPLSLANIRQQVLDTKSALLLYNLGEQSSYLWIITPTDVAVTRLPARAAVEQKVYDLRAQLISVGERRAIAGIDAPADETRGLALGAGAKASSTPAQKATAATYAPVAYDLYNTILGPAAPLVGNNRLVVVADGALNFVPFVALVTAPAATATDYGALAYLVKTNEVVYAPSASVISAVRQQASQARQTGKAGANRPMLIVADPIFSQTDVRVQPAAGEGTRSLIMKTAFGDVTGGSSDADESEIKRLTNTRTEADEIARLARAAQTSADLLLDLEASETNVAGRDLQRYGVLHFATHGLLDATHPQFTGLVLSLVGEQKQDGFLRVSEVFNYRLSTPLVMLSACETGLGRVQRGEGVIGLSRAFMYAGAPTVGVSLWSIADRSTSLLMGDFYQAYLAGQGTQPAGALRSAQLKMLANPRYSAPFFWAPFIMIGDWT